MVDQHFHRKFNLLDVGYRHGAFNNGVAMNGEEYVLNVPFVEGLDAMPMASVADYMELHLKKVGINCVNWEDKYPYHPITVFSMAYSDKFLYVNYFVRCNYLRAVNYKNNSPVAEDSCVEFFLQTPGSEEYWNFEFNCIGAINASHRKDRKHPIRLTDMELATVKRYATCGNNPFQELEGIFNWGLAIAIPFDLIGVDVSKRPIEMKGNLYKCASATSMPHYLSWASIETEKGGSIRYVLSLEHHRLCKCCMEKH